MQIEQTPIFLIQVIFISKIVFNINVLYIRKSEKECLNEKNIL